MHVALTGKIGETYNIGGHNELQNIEVVKTICSILDELVPSKLDGIATGIKKTIQWYLDNKTWCEHVQDGSYQGERLGVVK